MTRGNPSTQKSRIRERIREMKKLERTIALIALATVICAWVGGALRYKKDLIPFIKQALPSADEFKTLSSIMYAGFVHDEAGERTIGYVAIEAAPGYGGPLRIAVGVDLEGNIIGISIVEHKETLAYFQRVIRRKIPSSLVGKKFSDPLIPGDDVDTVSGATSTVNAITKSVHLASRRVAGKELNLPVPPEEKKPFKLGLPEIFLVVFFGIGFAGYWKKILSGKLVLWISRLTGLVVLGFIFNIPLTLVNVNSLLLGYWPSWKSHIFWYLIEGGVLLSVVSLGRSPYCEKFCPFGSTQECLGAIGGAKPRIPTQLRHRLSWIQRILAWAAILMALFFRNPGLSSYEVFGTLFDLTGTKFQFGLLAVILIASLFLKRPWCNYLCPLRAVTDYLKMIRGWITELKRAKGNKVRGIPVDSNKS